MLQSDAWEQEYAHIKAIPSSTRLRPSSAVKYIVEESKYIIGTGRRVLDLGCGAGRNAMYLAQSGYNVTAIDFCSSALGQLKEKYNESFVTGSLHTTLCDITETLPFANNSFDAVFDIVTTTSISHDQMKCFELELRRVIEPGGILVSYVHSNGDGYLQSVAPGEDAYVIQDNQIIDHTWTKAELESLYARWDVLHFRHVEKTDTLAGRNYTRRLWYLVLRNRE